MTTFYAIIRWVHVLAGAAWLGEVVTVTLIFVPMIAKMPPEERSIYMARIFPRVFRLASVLVALTLGAGALLNYQLTGWRNWGLYFSSPRWFALFLGGLLGLLLGAFHFIVEPRLESRIDALLGSDDPHKTAAVTRALQIIPRVGLGILVIVFLSMMVFARSAG